MLRYKPATDIGQSAQPTTTVRGHLLSSVYVQEASRNSKVTLHVTLLGVGGTIYNQYTITPILKLGIPLHKVHQLATERHCPQLKKTRQNTRGG